MGCNHQHLNDICMFTFVIMLVKSKAHKEGCGSLPYFCLFPGEVYNVQDIS